MTEQLSDPFSCAAASLARGEKVAGTGISATRFLLVEHAGAWAFNAWRGLFEGHPVIDVFAEWEPRGGRVQLIRKYGRRKHTPGESQRVFLVVDGTTWHSTWTGLDDLAKLIRADLDGLPLEDVMEPYRGADLTLVCTHAQHDKCCAVNGRQVAAALDAVDPEGTWESSHLGGDRFAANVLLFPELLQLGRVPADDAADVVAAHRSGVVDPDIVRGVAGLKPAEQFALTHIAAAQRQDYRTMHAETVASEASTPDSSEVLDSTVENLIHTVKVTTAEGPTKTLKIRERQSKTPTFNTCRRTKEATYRVLELD